MNWPIEELAIVLDFPAEYRQFQALGARTRKREETRWILRNIDATLRLHIEVPTVSGDAAIGDIVAVAWGNPPQE